MKKAFIILCLLFVGQFLLSCVNDCGGGGSGTYEVIYKGVEVYPARMTANLSYQILDNTEADREGFALDAVLNFDLNSVGMLLPQSNYGFLTAMACEPVPPTYLQPNRITTFEIFVIDTQTDEKTKITTSFLLRNYLNEWLSIEAFFDQATPSAFQRRYDEPFIFKLKDSDAPPQNSVFVVEAHLEGGEILSQSSKKVFFNQ